MTRITKAKELMQEGKSSYKKSEDERFQEKLQIALHGGENKKTSQLEEIWMRSIPRRSSLGIRNDTPLTSIMSDMNHLIVLMFQRKLPTAEFKNNIFTFDVGSTKFDVKVFTDTTIAGSIQRLAVKEKKFIRYKTLNSLSWDELRNIGLLDDLEDIVKAEYQRRILGAGIFGNLYQSKRRRLFANR